MGPVARGLQAPHVAPSRLYLVLSILICWHVKVGDKETCGNQSSYGCSTDRLLYLDQRHERLVPRNERMVRKYERLASWHCRKLLLDPLLPTVPFRKMFFDIYFVALC